MVYPISVCMIARNEEANIAQSLNSIKPFVQEIIVVDTGSTDATREIAENSGASIHSFEWNGNFSDARNAAIDQATQPYILVLDADEQFDPASESLLQAFCLRQDQAAGRVLLKNYTDEDGTYTTAELTRLFPNLPGFRYHGQIHEQLLYLGQTPMSVSTMIRIDHFGYLPTSLRKANKMERNLRLLLEEAQREPGNPYVLYQLGRTYAVNKQYGEAKPYFQAVIDLWGQSGDPLPSYAPSLLVHFAYCLLHRQEYSELFQVVEIGTELYPDLTDLYFVYGVALVEMKDVRNLDDIRSTFEYCLQLGEPDPTRYETVHGVGSFKAQYNLGVYYEVTGDNGNARRYYQAAAEQGYLPAQTRLQLLLTN